MTANAVVFQSPIPTSFRTMLENKSVALLRAFMEVTVLAMILIGPWMYGAVHPGFELVLDAGLALLLLFWGLRMVFERRVRIARCPVTVLLALYVLLSFLQITPLPPRVIAVLSPASANLQQKLLPTNEETVPGSEPSAPSPEVLSLYPYASRAQCFRYLAVLLLFAAVRNNLASTGCVTRFAFLSVLNGVALCMFGLIQYFTSDHHHLYWTYPALGAVFGPFVSRNLFPFYVNCCIGMAIGLLLARRAHEEGGHRTRKRPARTGMLSQATRSVTSQLASLLHDAPSLWLGCGLAFMAGTIFFTLSRGGVVALIAETFAAFGLYRSREGRTGKLVGAALLGLCTLILVGVFGLTAVEDRLGTLAEPDKADSARLPLWQRSFPLALEFPLAGTGLGTYQYVELWSRSRDAIQGTSNAADVSVEPLIFEHAHNDYLEVLVESGFPGLFLLLAAVAMTFHLGLIAAGRKRSGRGKGFAIGCLAALVAVLVHSIVDFGMRAPAIACMVTVIGAMTCGLGARAAAEHTQAMRRAISGAKIDEVILPAWELNFGVVGALCAMVVLAMAGALLCIDQWRNHRVERYQAAAAAVPLNEPTRKEMQLQFYQAASRLAPRDASANLDVARCYLDIYRESIERAEARERLGVFIDSVGATPAVVVSLGGGQSPLNVAQGWLAHWLAREELVAMAQKPDLVKEFYPGLRYCVLARDACPLMPEAQIFLALNADRLVNGDPAQAYFDRAKLLAARLPDVWFFSGIDQLAKNHRDLAWQDWHQCLMLSDRFLDAILIRAVGSLTTGDAPTVLIGKVLPDDQPQTIFKAANRLFAGQANRPIREAYYKAALNAFSSQKGMPPVPLALQKAQAEFELGRLVSAESTLQSILLRDTWNLDAHMLLASVYWGRDDLERCAHELRIVLEKRGGTPGAQEFYQKVQTRLAQERRNPEPFDLFDVPLHEPKKK